MYTALSSKNIYITTTNGTHQYRGSIDVDVDGMIIHVRVDGVSKALFSVYTLLSVETSEFLESMQRRLLIIIIQDWAQVFLVTPHGRKTQFMILGDNYTEFIRFFMGIPTKIEDRTNNSIVFEYNWWDITLRQSRIILAIDSNFRKALLKYKELRDAYMLYALFNLEYSLYIDTSLINTCAGALGS